jgi:hypothetical protein
VKQTFSKYPQLPLAPRLRHALITSRWQQWLFPALCSLPYLICLLWLLSRGLIWVAQVMLAPLLMAGALALLTLWLAQQEFRGPKTKG